MCALRTAPEAHISVAGTSQLWDLGQNTFLLDSEMSPIETTFTIDRLLQGSEL